MGTNWQNAPEWARYAAVDVFSGKQYFSSSRPTEEAGWTQIEERPCAGDSYCSGWVEADSYLFVERIQPLRAWLEENPDMKTSFIPTFLNGDGECVNATDHAAELAEALEYLFDYTGPMGPWEIRRVAHDALKSYKQSRGE